MSMGNLSRRGFVQRSLAGLAAAGLPLWYAREAVEGQLLAADESNKRAPGDKIAIGLIGCGGQGRGVMGRARGFKEVQVVAVCDVDKKRREEVVGKDLGGSKGVKSYEDYRDLLDNKDVTAVIIGTPDHWHALTAIAAMRKGKDVYCEKPLTLTVAEADAVAKVAKATGRIFQVGSQQRSEGPFRLACELVRNGRLGKVQSIETRIGDNPRGGPFKPSDPPEGLNWEFWQGPVPKVEYVKQRCHYEFRWWYEYSGGKMTDWGAHHNDVAQWALDMDGSGPVSVASRGDEPAKGKYSYNCHPHFEVDYVYKDGTKLRCMSKGENGVRFEGEGGKWLFVSRGTIYASDQEEKPTPGKKGAPGKKGSTSKIIDEPLGKDAVRLYPSTNHMKNWLDGIKTGKATTCPASVGASSVIVCHIGAISLRLGGKKLVWDPAAHRFDDEAANKMLSRAYHGEWKLEA